ncbi:hypothetical protein LX64_00326 [Chitinophaga skermanii]|uniref:Methylamine utilisation protein MauE domain-containing protein n=2 Tax=Chitinophaga skermanii TaxID=331697 RepID=A0A327R225_9BACT|nr:hypothetical protein LX64_00326 [Chitinophaga skermanii]
MPIFLKKINYKEIIIELIAAIFIVLWFYTGITKIMDFDETKVQMSRSPFIHDFSTFLAYTVPPFEVLVGILFIFKKTKHLAFLISFILMFAFTGYIYLMLTYAYDLPCSCGGIINKLNWEQHLYLNAVLTVLATLGYFLTAKRKS